MTFKLVPPNQWRHVGGKLDWLWEENISSRTHNTSSREPLAYRNMYPVNFYSISNLSNITILTKKFFLYHSESNYLSMTLLWRYTMHTSEILLCRGEMIEIISQNAFSPGEVTWLTDLTHATPSIFVFLLICCIKYKQQTHLTI